MAEFDPRTIALIRSREPELASVPDEDLRLVISPERVTMWLIEAYLLRRTPLFNDD